MMLVGVRFAPEYEILRGFPPPEDPVKTFLRRRVFMGVYTCQNILETRDQKCLDIAERVLTPFEASDGYAYDYSSYEYHLLVIGLTLILVIVGGGKFSVDQKLSEKIG